MSIILSGSFSAASPAVIAAASRAVRGTAMDVLADAQEAIQTGEKSGKQTKNHRASAPGQAPATDTGNLVISGAVDVGADGLTATVTFSSEYAEDLELGTVRMAPRPFLAPAVEKNREAFVDALVKAVSLS